MTNAKLKKGYTLVEMVVYVAILSIITVVIANTLVSFSRSYRDLLALRIVDHSGIDAMERITRDTRSATTVDLANSTLGTSPGVLTLIKTTNSISTTTKFYIQNGILKTDVNGTYSGPLTLSKASVTNLVFTKINSSVGSAVKVDMTIGATVGAVTKNKNYHSTIILKGI